MKVSKRTEEARKLVFNKPHIVYDGVEWSFWGGSSPDILRNSAHNYCLKLNKQLTK